MPYVDTVRVFNIRNGTPEEACSLLVRPAIAECFHWSPIDGMPPDAAIRYIKAYIDVAHTQLDVQADWTPAKKRKIAMAIGVTRAVATAYYRVIPADLTPGETAPSLLRYVPATTGDGAVPAHLERNVIPGSNPPATYVIRAITDWTEAENNQISKLIQFTVGTIPLQGHSLLVSGHHYLSEAASQSRKGFAAVEKQFMLNADIRGFLETDTEAVQDALWHKACHPILPNFKLEMAASETVRAMVLKAGNGAAATRLPAVEAEAKALTSYRAVFAVCDPVWSMFGGSVDYSMLDLVINTVKRFPPAIEDVTVLNPRDALIPPSVVNRRTALNWAAQIVENNAPKAAIAFGFFEAMKEVTGGANLTPEQNSLSNAKSLIKLKGTQMPSYMLGRMDWADYQAAKNKQRQQGIYKAHNMTVE
jgi:hypothetical protein